MQLTTAQAARQSSIGFTPEFDIDADELQAIFQELNAEEFDALYRNEAQEPETTTLDNEYPW